MVISVLHCFILEMMVLRQSGFIMGIKTGHTHTHTASAHEDAARIVS